MAKQRFKRVILKISGESLSGSKGYGIDTTATQYVAQEVQTAINASGVQLAIVVGGGNIWRGGDAESQGMDRATADYAGMLATLINALSLQDAMERQGIDTRTQTAISIQAIAEPYIRRRAIRHLEKGRVVIFGAGTGNPYMTTDTTASLRALEMDADAILMAKNNVDGVYDDDPNKNPNAKKLGKIEYLDVLNRHLEVMDSSALTLCMDHNIPIIVFNLFNPNSITQILEGKVLGTLISN
ncbi:MAG: UMP kinase [Dehalococcoidia bacterium]|nr:UMP kinase [Dehalococcoidia bacterium]|tara:strand:+ start:2079 stop:2801 length:723 start_codon:yes stop_codon:yes gene_type:complete